MSDNRQEQRDRLAEALGLGVGVTTGLAANEGVYHHLRDMAEDSKVRKTRDWKKFLAKLQPGDTIYHRIPDKMSGSAEFGDLKFPISESSVLKTVKGDPYFHGSIYEGKGKVIESVPEGVKRSSLAKVKDYDDLKVYRPKNTRTMKQAVDFAQKSIGRDYATDPELLKHGLSHNFGFKEVPSQICRKIGGNVTCTGLIAEAYPKMLKDAQMSPAAMRHSADFDLIARYNKSLPVTLRERLLTRGAYPMIKNAKYGVLAGLLGYGLLKGRDALNGEQA